MAVDWKPIFRLLATDTNSHKDGAASYRQKHLMMSSQYRFHIAFSIQAFILLNANDLNVINIFLIIHDAPGTKII